MPSPLTLPRRCLVPFAFTLAATALPATAAAQEAPSLPFTAGQKALHVSVGESFGIGGLIFRSPTSAWLLEGSAQLSRTDEEQRHEDGTEFDRDQSSLTLQLRGGLRGMRPLGENVLAYRTIGLTGGFGRGSFESAGGTESETTNWNAGVFLDLGGQYLFSPRFGLGVEVGAALRYQRTTIEGGFSEIEASGFSLGTTAGRLTGTLYF